MTKTHSNANEEMCLNRFLTKRRLDMTTRDESKQRKKKKKKNFVEEISHLSPTVQVQMME